jgi:hypothetical protein
MNQRVRMSQIMFAMSSVVLSHKPLTLSANHLQKAEVQNCFTTYSATAWTSQFKEHGRPYSNDGGIMHFLGGHE